MKIKRIIKPLVIIGAGFAVMAIFGGVGVAITGTAYGAKGLVAGLFYSGVIGLVSKAFDKELKTAANETGKLLSKLGNKLQSL